MRPTLIAVGCALALSACSPASPPAQPQDAAYKPVVSLNEIMVNIVDTHSHELWDATGSPAKAPPKTEEDWRNLRRAAVTLAAAGNLTKMSGNGPKDQVWREQKDWDKLSQAIADAGLAATKAVQSRNLEALDGAGGQLLMACLNCHKEYKLQVPEISAEPELHTPEF